MLLNITFNCSCGSFIDKNIQIDDAILDPKNIYYEQLICDGCGKDYEVRIEDRSGKLRVDVDGSTNLDYETVAEDDYWKMARYGHVLDDRDEELSWVIQSTAQLGTFERIMKDVVAILRAEIKIPNMSTLYNMTYAQVVTAVEAYLSGVFIHKVVNSGKLMRKLVESDPEFSKRQLPLAQIFLRWEGLKLEVARYLQDLIFHDLRKINKMYQSVLGIDLGKIPWLYKAILLRHDCVHRNGVDKEGKPTGIDQEAVEALIVECARLIARIDKEVAMSQTFFSAPE